MTAHTIERMSNGSDEQAIIGIEDCAVRVVDRERVAMVTGAMPAGGDIEGLADVFGLLADAGRLRVLVALLEGEMCVCDLAAVAGTSESAASHHLRLLRAHRVVQVRRAGRMAYYRLADAHMRMLLDVALTHIGHAPAAAHPEHAGPDEGRAGPGGE
jgi:ArsR family transcriptional regulator, lead/cadmium/zinc/bismuth-responsive transcriptional repressor